VLKTTVAIVEKEYLLQSNQTSGANER
jgi:hypothetical protein